jgi:hypothetical protein
MKTLVVVTIGLGDVVVDAPEGHRLLEGSHGRPVPPVDHQRPLGGGGDLPRARQEVRPAHPRHPLVGENERDVLARLLEVLQTPEGGFRVPLAHHAVVLPVALVQLT